MNERQRELLELHMLEIEGELQDIANLRVDGDDEGDSAAVEDALLDRKEEIEWRLGVDYIERRDAGGRDGRTS
jgi:hypothetical protein